MNVVEDTQTILTVTENGDGKRTPVLDYRRINRGGKGVRNIICSERNGFVAAVRAVHGDEEVLLISRQGIIIRTNLDQISTIGRNTQGLRVMRLDSGDQVKRVALVNKEALNESEEESTTK